MAPIDQTSTRTLEDRLRDVSAQAQRNPAMAAALLGGAAAATAGAVWGARTLARRNASGDGRPLNAVMQNAVTACELAHSRGLSEPAAPREPAVPAEPKVTVKPVL